ncbi:hypothetical protein OSB04_022912 [Centaurea solstitialis]|uniref:Uncharacterized protein n=1 Tax=Centaurea solstitialis TaxID=347529 RepID=A0AA38SVK5_9ASTR|nr:hypothetical protein OSB04_022912 [Centaurea solstitialis]
MILLQDSQRLLPNYELREDMIRSSPLNMNPQQSEEPWKPISRLIDNNHFVMIEPTVSKSALIDIQDSYPNLPLFSFGITEQCTRHNKLVKFLMSGLSELERDGMDLLSLSDLNELQTITTDYKPYFHDVGPTDSPFIYPNLEFDSQKPLMDFVGDLARRSEITKTEMKNILSILAEFYLLKNSSNWRKQSTLVPQFNWLETSYYGSALELENVIVAPPKSPEKIKSKPSQKKKGSRNKASIRHQSNYIQACESLLSIIVDKNRNGKSAIPVLKKSGPELPNLLTQFSASIAGMGIAVLFSVTCKLASGRVPFCASKLLNTGLGLGLVWLSWGVNKLRDTIMVISKNSNKKGLLKDEEMMKDLDRSVKEIYFRGVALMAVMVLRLA